MQRDELRAYCASLPGAEETFPFDMTTLVVKVMGKMFALIPTDLPPDEPATISLKCDPIHAELLREQYPAVRPGYHLNKRHWNTVTCDGSVPDAEITEMIDNSYDLVVRGLPRRDRETLAQISNRS
ncbi:MAG: MmcQ/YjbR family DNA-binding protein [Phototrophicaceae bacterium]